MKTLGPLSSLVLCAFTLIACQPESPTGPTSPVLPSAPSSPSKQVPQDVQPKSDVEIISEKFEITMVRNQGLNSYSIRISTNLPSHLYEVYRSENAEELGRLLKPYESSADAFTEKADVLTYSPKTVHYKIVVGEHVLHKQSFQVKADLVIEGVVYANSLLSNSSYNLATVIFKKGSHLYLKDLKTKIQAEEVYAHDAQISGFNADDLQLNTFDGLSGMSAGSLEIKTAFFSGGLKIDLRGAAGMQGQVGSDSIVRGNKGKDGKDEQFTVEEDCTPSGSEFSFRCKKQLVCKSPAEAGEIGDEGPRGGPGNPGGDAGAGGTFLLEADHSDNFYAEYDSSAGTIGVGGEGGKGGPGGFRGKPGVGGKYCKAVSVNSDEGPRGPDGFRGLDGAKSEDGQACFKIRSMKINSCGVKGVL